MRRCGSGLGAMYSLHTTESENEINRTLMWLCFLTQGLLREAQSGGRQGGGLVAKRFNFLYTGDWVEG